MHSWWQARRICRRRHGAAAGARGMALGFVADRRRVCLPPGGRPRPFARRTPIRTRSPIPTDPKPRAGGIGTSPEYWSGQLLQCGSRDHTRLFLQRRHLFTLTTDSAGGLARPIRAPPPLPRASRTLVASTSGSATKTAWRLAAPRIRDPRHEPAEEALADSAAARLTDPFSPDVDRSPNSWHGAAGVRDGTPRRCRWPIRGTSAPAFR